MITIIEVTLGQEMLEEHKFIEVRILEVDIVVILGIITLQEVEVGLGNNCTWEILGDMRDAVVDLD